MKKLKIITNGVSKRVKEVRAGTGLTQAVFGAKIGVSVGYMGMLENGRRKPSQGLIIAISSRFGVDENWLRTGRRR